MIAKYAKERGREHEVAGWVCLGVFISPLLALIILFCSADLKEIREEKERAQKQENMKKSYIDTDQFMQSLGTASSLCDNGIISEQEYAHKKTELINKLISKKIMGQPDEFLLALVPFLKDGKITDEEIARIKKLI